MKKFSILLFALCISAILFVGCGKQEIDEFTLEKKEITTEIDMIQFYKTAKHVDYYGIGIGQSPILFMLDKQDENADIYIKLIKNASIDGVPLKITYDNNTKYLTEVTNLNDKELENWKSIKEEKYDLLGSNESEISEVFLNERSSVNYLNFSNVEDAFNYASSSSCDLNQNTDQDGCISFPYKADGCYARAHKMRQIFEAEYDRSCYKMFVYGDVENGKPLNVPGCNFGWRYHVAPIIYGGSWYVIDPSISNEPLSRSDWKALMGSDNICKTEYYNAAAYMPQNTGCGDRNYWTDSNYSHTNWTLGSYQNYIGCNAN